MRETIYMSSKRVNDRNQIPIIKLKTVEEVGRLVALSAHQKQ